MSLENNQSGRILITGDLFPMSHNAGFFEAADISSLFGDKLSRMFASADYAICNLEGALTDHNDRGVKTGQHMTAPTGAVKTYQALGIDCCALANNHITDGDHQGVLDTMKTLKDAEIAFVGAGANQDEIERTHFFEVGGMKFCLYNVCERMYNKPTESKGGAWLYDEYLVCRELAEAKSNCDYLMVIYHGGMERFHYPSPETRKRFYRMADSGADLIVSQHTHCVGCEEYYHGAYLLYGQGNFLLQNVAPRFTETGLLLELVVENGSVTINKHWVRSEKNCFVRYCETQDFTEFDERSGRLQDERFMSEEVRRYCRGELRKYLTAFKNPGLPMRVVRKFFPKIYQEWLFAYSRRNLLFTLHTLRSEQNRETAVIGLETLAENLMEK